MLCGNFTDRGRVQLRPSEAHSCLSSSLRVSCSSEMAELVMAGLDTEAPSAGPPVVFTIWVTQTHKEERKEHDCVVCAA